MRETMAGKSSKKALSPLLAIIIGLAITVVAGILLAQLFFGYASTISMRPAANIEYVDLVTAGQTSILAVNIKNMGNVPIISAKVEVGNAEVCTIEKPVPPGGVGGCSGSVTVTGNAVVGIVEVNFDTDGDNQPDSTQVYSFSARARSA